MNDLRQAAQQALEALEAKGDAWIVLERKAIISLRAALAETTQEPYGYQFRYDKSCYKCKSMYCPADCKDTTPPAAQPDYEFDYKLAFNEWLDKTEWVQEKINSGHLGVRYLGMHRADVLRDLAYLNTVTGKAPQQRPWVGLTDEDKKKIATAAGCTEDDDGHVVTEIFRLAEAKLKERNT